MKMPPNKSFERVLFSRSVPKMTSLQVLHHYAQGKINYKPFPIYSKPAADDFLNTSRRKYEQTSITEGIIAEQNWKHCGKWRNCSC